MWSTREKPWRYVLAYLRGNTGKSTARMATILKLTNHSRETCRERRCSETAICIPSYCYPLSPSREQLTRSSSFRRHRQDYTSDRNEWNTLCWHSGELGWEGDSKSTVICVLGQLSTLPTQEELSPQIPKRSASSTKTDEKAWNKTTTWTRSPQIREISLVVSSVRGKLHTALQKKGL